jgi:5-methylcytosine-specific restriction endonuclease McrA
VTSPGTTPFEGYISSSDLVWYLRSPRWQQTRKAALLAMKYRCQRCGMPTRRVRHLHFRTLGFERFEDLVVECLGCFHRTS